MMVFENRIVEIIDRFPRNRGSSKTFRSMKPFRESKEDSSEPDNMS